jgi:hypothetical protein
MSVNVDCSTNAPSTKFYSFPSSCNSTLSPQFEAIHTQKEDMPALQAKEKGSTGIRTRGLSHYRSGEIQA